MTLYQKIFLLFNANSSALRALPQGDGNKVTRDPTHVRTWDGDSLFLQEKP